MTDHRCPDWMCSHRSLLPSERARLYPTEATLSEQMVRNHFEVASTEAVFRAIFDQFVRREVA